MLQNTFIIMLILKEKSVKGRWKARWIMNVQAMGTRQANLLMPYTLQFFVVYIGVPNICIFLKFH